MSLEESSHKTESLLFTSKTPHHWNK